MSIQTTPSGLQYEDVVVGSGAEATAGAHVTVHYTGWLYDDGRAGRKFDSSKDRGQPFDFPLGAGHVIRGWDEGVQGMKIGGTRRLIIPAALGWFILLAAQRVGNSVGWDQTIVTTSTALVLVVGYLLLQAAHKISRDNREKDGASF